MIVSWIFSFPIYRIWLIWCQVGSSLNFQLVIITNVNLNLKIFTLENYLCCFDIWLVRMRSSWRDRGPNSPKKLHPISGANFSFEPCSSQWIFVNVCSSWNASGNYGFHLHMTYREAIARLRTAAMTMKFHFKSCCKVFLDYCNSWSCIGWLPI